MERQYSHIDTDSNNNGFEMLKRETVQMYNQCFLDVYARKGAEASRELEQHLDFVRRLLASETAEQDAGKSWNRERSEELETLMFTDLIQLSESNANSNRSAVKILRGTLHHRGLAIHNCNRSAT